jgi:hypothetical protein
MPCRIAKSYYFPDRHLHQTFSRQRVLQDMTLLCSLNPCTQPRCSHEYRSASHCEKKFRLSGSEIRKYRVEIGPEGKRYLRLSAPVCASAEMLETPARKHALHTEVIPAKSEQEHRPRKLPNAIIHTVTDNAPATAGRWSQQLLQGALRSGALKPYTARKSILCAESHRIWLMHNSSAGQFRALRHPARSGTTITSLRSGFSLSRFSVIPLKRNG